MAARFFRDNFFRAIRSIVQTLHHLSAIQCLDNDFDVRNFHKDEARSLVGSFREGSARVLHTFVRLVHEFDRTAFESYEADVIAFRNLYLGLEAKALHPKLKTRL